MLHYRRHLLPPPHGWAIGVREARVVSMRVQLLHRLGVALHELIERATIELNGVVKRDRSHG
jgi:hypothetical protein